MALMIFNDIHFASENATAPNCTRVMWDNDDGSTSFNNLKIYRFGDRTKAYDWTSPKRQTLNANFPRLPDYALDALALSQVRFGRKGAVGPDTPFVSVATNYQALYANGEPWVQALLRSSPDVGVFAVPFTEVMRPGINSHATKVETEWLFYDGNGPLLDHLIQWMPNPY